MKIISGGQTGADKGALKAAKYCNIETGGYAPSNYMTELGSDKTLSDYGLIDSGLGYVGRTTLNVNAADITIWFGRNDTAGYKATKNACVSSNKLFVNVTGYSPEDIDYIISPYNIINVAGNRESKSIGIEKTVYYTLVNVFKHKRQVTL